jgi:protein phosphatase 1G
MLRYAATGMQGWRKRMEDSHIADLDVGQSKTNIFGVFDGHGGKEVAVYVKKHFTEYLLNNQSFQANDIKKALVENFLKMDEIMVEKNGKAELKYEAKKAKEEDDVQNKQTGKNSMDAFHQMVDPKTAPDADIAMFTGCTACAVAIHEGKIICANAGDSRAVLSRKGVAYPLSVDHKPELEVEINRIEKAGGWVSDGRVKGNLNLSRSLGDLEYKQNKKIPAEQQMITAYPDIHVEEFTDDCEFMVLGCDGIWDCKTNQEAVDFVGERLKKNPNAKLSKIIEELLDEILAPDIYTETGVGCDNMTCVIVQFKKQTAKK